MDGKNSIPKSVEDSILSQIEYHEQQILNLKFTLKLLKEHPPKQAEWQKMYAPLTRDTLRKFFRNINRPVRTKEIIDMIYPNVPDRPKLIKTASVMLNQMEKEGEIKIERKAGIKGNYYSML